MPELKLNSPLQYIKGVGPRKAEALAAYGYKTVYDLLFRFPRLYLDRTNVVPIGDARVDQSVTVIGQVKAHGMLYGKRRRYEVILEDDSGAIQLVWFQGVRYFERLFKKGQKYAATGKVTSFMGAQMVHPDLERLEDDSAQMVHAGRIIPVYPQTAELNKIGLNSKGVRRLTTAIFESLKERIPDPLPSDESKRLKLPALHDAISTIHYPADRDILEKSRRRLAFDELLAFLHLVFKSKQNRQIQQKAHKYNPPGELLSSFKSSIGFELTSGQKKTVREIFDDLQQSTPMTRMLQGDVGCGKTVVAVLAALYVAENKMQTAFMVPTEILAEQHYRNWQPLLAKVGVSSALLTSSLKAADKKNIAESCAAGEIDILFGTHALIYDYVSFDNLGMVIIDEQHRFGVEQRSKLHAKGDNPDLLVMTATPIPRTLALTLYGDLQISTIDTLPPGRKPIRTVWRKADVADKVWKWVADEIKKGGQAYIIYPLIETSERMELENVEDAFAELSKTFFADCSVGMVHGRVKPKDRDDTLEKFRRGEIDILMATTVIEVGIDNPNATIMVIEHAERFGLAQLHQLRGRIGRGDQPATLTALAHPPISEIGQQRLEYFVLTTDGFKIAEADLELRGPGEMFGRRQSGAPEMKVASLSRDRDLLEAANQLLTRLFNSSAGSLDSDYTELYNYLNRIADSKVTDLSGG